MATDASKSGEQTLFVRKASGLVKGWSTGDGFRYSFFSVNLFLAFWSMAYACFITDGSLFWSIVITAAFMIVEIIVYAGLISAMPRAGGDYVWLTRIFHSSIGFIVAAVGWWFILWLWTPIYADMGVQTTVKPIFRILGLNGAADFLSKPAGIFVASMVVIAIASILVAIGMKTYAKLQKYFMYIGLAAIVVLGIVLLISSSQNFKEKFNSAAVKYYGDTAQGGSLKESNLDLTKYKTDENGLFATDADGAYIPDGEHATAWESIEATGSGTGMPSSAFAGTLKGTLWLIPLMLFWMAWPNWGATLYGEVRGAKDFRKNIYQMAGGLFLPTAIVLIFLFLMNWKVGYQSWLGTYASYWWGISPLGGDSISPTAMVSFLLPNSALQIILIGAASLILFGWFGTLFLSSTRMIFAAAFDRILPEWVAKVSSGGVPYNALIFLMTIPSIIVASLYAGWPISWTNATTGVTWIKDISYDATLGIVIMFFFCGLAFMVMKWRARGVWENSSLPKSGLGAIPWMSILAAIYAVFMGWNIYMFIWDPLGAYAVGYKNKASFIFMISLYGLAAVVWIISYFVRKRQGMELEAVAKEIPVE